MLVDLEKSKRLFFKPSYISELLHDSSDDKNKSAKDNEDVDDDENTGDDGSDLEPKPTVPKPTKKVVFRIS